MPLSFDDLFEDQIDFTRDADGRFADSAFRCNVFRNGPSVEGGQNHHLVSNESASRSALLKILDHWGRQNGRSPGDYYDHNDFGQNGINLSTDPNVAHLEGRAVHGNHAPYSNNLVTPFLETLDRELQDELDAHYDSLIESGRTRKQAIEEIRTGGWLDQRLRYFSAEVKGFQAVLHSGLVVSRHPDGTIRPKFAISENDRYAVGRDLAAEYQALNANRSAGIRSDPLFAKGRAGTYTRTHSQPDLKNDVGKAVSAVERATYQPDLFGEEATKSGAKSRGALGNLLENKGGAVSGRVATALAVGAVAIQGGLWVKDQIDAGRSFDDIFADIKQSVSSIATDDVLRAGTTLVVGGLATAAVGIVLGPVGVAALVAWDVISSWEDFQQAISDLSEAMPDWDFLKSVLHFMETVEAPVRQVIDTISKSFKSFTDEVRDLAGLFIDALPKVQMADGTLVIQGREGRDLMIGSEAAELFGNAGNDWFLHSGFGKAYGGAGADTLVGWLGGTIKAGEAISNDVREREADEQRAYAQAVAAWIAGGRQGDAPTPPQRDADVPRAQQDASLTLDGGEGNDWVIAIGGEKAVTAGGLGRDWIFNTSTDGILWGDYANGVDENGNRAEDSSGNADNFWFFPDTVVMDAQRYDVLKFFGIPLTGGDAAASGVSLAIGGSLGGLFGAAGTVAAANFAAAATGNKVYFDNLLPFITYKLDGDDLLVGNVFDGFFRAVTGREGIFSIDNSDGTTSDVGGVMRIRDFAKDGGFVSTIWGFQTADPTLQAFTDEGPAGKFNMVFTPDQVRGGHPAILRVANDNFAMCGAA